MNQNSTSNIVSANHSRTSRQLLHALLLGAAVLITSGSAQAKTAVAVEMDLQRPFGVEPWGIATGDGTRANLQDLARRRCLARGGREAHIYVVFYTNRALQGPSALVLGRTKNGGKLGWVASGRTLAEAVAIATAKVRSDGAISWYTAKSFIAR